MKFQEALEKVVSLIYMENIDKHIESVVLNNPTYSNLDQIELDGTRFDFKHFEKERCMCKIVEISLAALLDDKWEIIIKTTNTETIK